MTHSTLGRIGDIVRSNVNELLDRLEDPEKLARQLLRDMELAVEQAVGSVSRAMARQRKQQREYEGRCRRVEEHAENARKAFAAGDEGLARKALELKLYYHNEAETLQVAVAESTKAVEQLKTRLARLREELQRARDRQGQLLAQIQLAGKSTSSSRPDADAQAEMSWLEQDLARKRNEFERLRDRCEEGGAGGVSEECNIDALEQHFADLDTREQVEKELEVLRETARGETETVAKLARETK